LKNPLLLSMKITLQSFLIHLAGNRIPAKTLRDFAGYQIEKFISIQLNAVLIFFSGLIETLVIQKIPQFALISVEPGIPPYNHNIKEWVAITNGLKSYPKILITQAVVQILKESANQQYLLAPLRQKNLKVRISTNAHLPDTHSQTIRPVHFISRLYTKCFIKFRNVNNRTVYSFFCGCMYIRHNLACHSLFSFFIHPA
jgi:hypothetical protein